MWDLGNESMGGMSTLEASSARRMFFDRLMELSCNTWSQYLIGGVARGSEGLP